MSKPRLTSRVRRGLAEVWSLAYHDLEAAEPGDYRADARGDLERALAYVHALADFGGRSEANATGPRNPRNRR